MEIENKKTSPPGSRPFISYSSTILFQSYPALGSDKDWEGGRGNPWSGEFTNLRSNSLGLGARRLGHRLETASGRY